MNESFEKFLKEYPQKSGLHGLIKTKDLGEWYWGRIRLFIMGISNEREAKGMRDMIISEIISGTYYWNEYYTEWEGAVACLGQAEIEKRLKTLHSPESLKGKEKVK